MKSCQKCIYSIYDPCTKEYLCFLDFMGSLIVHQPVMNKNEVCEEYREDADDLWDEEI